MKKQTEFLGVAIALIALIFGDNLYEQITGRSFVERFSIKEHQPTETPLPQTQSTIPPFPFAQPQLDSTPAIQSLGSIIVMGNSNTGVQIQIPRSGIYRFAYHSGAYADYAIGKEPHNTNTWLTQIFIYKGQGASWNGRIIQLDNLLIRLADTGHWPSADEAEQNAQGQFAEALLSEGDVITLIAVDAFDSYADNPGKIFIDWFFAEY